MNRNIPPIARPMAGVTFVIVAGALLAGCGSTTPASPSSSGSSTSTGTTANVTISIVGNAGSQAFTPNPAAVPAGQTLVFRNNTGSTHHVVADNGTWDAGTIGPGATSSVINVSVATSVSYHCTIHSSMVGGIN